MFQTVSCGPYARFLHDTASLFIVAESFQRGNARLEEVEPLRNDAKAFVILEPLVYISQLVTCFIADPGHKPKIPHCGEEGCYAWEDICTFPNFFERSRALPIKQVGRVMQILKLLYLCFESKKGKSKVGYQTRIP